MKEQKIGEINELFHYLVKGMKGTSLKKSKIGWHGLENDRKYAFVDPKNSGGFPWITGRKKPLMIQYRPEMKEEVGSRKGYEVIVHSPEGKIYNIKSDELAEDISSLFGTPVKLFAQNRGCFDAMPISLISYSTLNQLSKQVGINLSSKRFRPNIVVDLLNDDPFAEESWIGKSIRFGNGENAPIIRFDRKNIRCVMITLDPTTAVSSPEVLKEVVQSRGKATGIYGTLVKQGKVKIGDGIYLI